MDRQITYHKINNTYNLEILKELKELYRLSFSDSSEYIDYYFEKKVTKMECRFLKLNDKIISALYLKKQKLNYHNTIIDSYLIVALSTHPKYQQQGYMRILINHLINELYDSNIALVTLHPNPVSDKFYKKFNFVPYTFFSITKATKSKDFTFKKATTNDIDILLELYNEFSKDYSFYPIRTKQYYLERLDELSVENDAIYIIFKNNKAVGYFLTSANIIEEYCFNGPLISNKAQYIEHNADHTNNVLNMARIINPLPLLENYPFKTNNFSISFKLVDQFNLNNSKMYILTISEKNTITNSLSYDLEITIDDLSTLLLIGNVMNNPHPFYQLFSKCKNISWEKY